MRALFDPRLRGGLPDHWPSRCIIQTITYELDASNQSIPTGVKNMPGMVGLQCRLGPIQEGTPMDTEDRGPAVTALYTRRQLKINGFFPLILAHLMIAVVDGVTYPIRAVESDSEKFSTRLRLEVVEP